MSTWWQLAIDLERSFAQGVRSFTKDLWKEDAISIDLVKRLRQSLGGARIDDEARTARIAARIFKADGLLEEAYGDIAILLKIGYSDGTELNGVAFYEAKRRDWEKHTLPAATKSQLQKMHRALWNARLLVYDREEVVSRLAEVTLSPWWWERMSRASVAGLVAPVTHCLAVPLGPALQASRLDKSLYKFGVPFGSQVVMRNLQGLDLDHDAKVLQAAAGYGDRMDVRPRLLLAVGVQEGVGDAELPEVNADVFSPLEQRDR